MKKIFTFILASVMMTSMITVSAFAAENSDDKNLENPAYSLETSVTEYPDRETDYILSGISTSMQAFSDNDIDFGTPADIEYIIANSSDIVTYANSTSGSFKSDKYDAGLPGYKYRISFDWTAKVNSSGQYIFDKITNPKVTTYENWFLLGFTWDYYNYTITKNVYYLSDSGRSITFNVNYDFTVMSSTSGIATSISENNVNVFKLDSIR